MGKYKYKAYDKYGKLRKGILVAKDEKELKIFLRKERLRLKEFFEIKENVKISKIEILNFTKEIIIMLESGISIIKVFEIQEGQYKSSFKNILKEMRENLLNGDSIGEVFIKNKKVFGNFYVGMVNLGDISGNLVENLKKICEHLELELAVVKKLKEVAFYPCIVLTFSVLILTFLMIFVFPNFIKIFEESKTELPLLTRILIKVSENFYGIIFIIICILIIIIFSLKNIKSNSRTKEYLDRVLLKIPLVRDFIIGNYIIRFSKNISIMLSSGMLILDILKLLRDFFDNTVIKKEIERLEKSLFDGQQLSEVMEENSLFPEKYRKLVVVGEKSGELIKIFEQIAKLEEERIENSIKKLLTLVEPILIIVLGLILSIIIIAIYLPIFNMSNLIY
ncbi:type II secretion system F family protein [uncultured Fusobacterium sp.]|uniref:type II secretion system F family protein n=2 Tax=uncultured Fusobacterium sp. TaxID=159267 RepID=UPI0025D8E032|nr:type II secretion system F family protein [uncultured Fusobacterium sp.]MCF2639490.1 type II secretion system F family protein [Fusobacterium varium]